MGEWLTVFDQQGKKVGKKLRDDIHRDGDLHETFHCWLLEPKKESIYLYFQLRAYDKKDFPGIWDITAAGHIMHNEDILTAGLREVEEELGLRFCETDLVYTGIYRINNEHPPLIDREMCHMYFHIVTEPLPFAPGDEVEDILKIEATSLLELLKGEQSSLTGISVLSKVKEPIVLTKEDFYPYDIAYYDFVVRHAIDLIKA
ncbi:NUDIX hydrolase [Bacillus thuringiensis]|uniref:NUDIX hydrolase n=1 Tax=Bacillus thuringiensis TaxID=1428 RepID=UPI000B416944|nr:NUDIX domain-containing protein [Bacillus thuringiensis]ARX70072.1 DNA mismatch repair protein MutT [Bacillus thuringiensis]MEB9697332.1 NUDIX domain-containing protein [Bacillus cereus]